MMQPPAQQPASTENLSPNTLLWIKVAALFAIFIAYHAINLVGVDYVSHFLPAIERGHAGEPLYSRGFFNPPWSLFAFEVFYHLGLIGAQAGIIIFTVATMFAAFRLYLMPDSGYAAPFALAFVFINLHMVDFVTRIQVEGFILLGVLFMYASIKSQNPYQMGFGWVLATIRPTSVLLLWPYTLWIVYQRGWRHLAQTMIIPLIAVTASFALYGNWLEELYVYMTTRERPPDIFVTAFWRAVSHFGFPTWSAIFLITPVLAITGWVLWNRPQLDLKTKMIYLILASLLVTPYVTSYHYTIMMAMFIPMLLQVKLWWGIPLYALTITPVTRPFIEPFPAWFDMGFIILAWGLTSYIIWTNQSPYHQPDNPPIIPT